MKDQIKRFVPRGFVMGRQTVPEELMKKDVVSVCVEEKC